MTRGHPQRTVLLAHHLYNVLDEDPEPADPAATAIDLALDETNDAHQAVWDSLGRVERIILVTVADGQAPTGTKASTEHRIARSTLQDALERLTADERHLHRDANGKFLLLDPLLAEWLRRR